MSEDYIYALKQVIFLSKQPGNKPVYINKTLLLHAADQLEDVVNLLRNEFLVDQPFKPATNHEHINLFNLISSKLILPNRVLSVYGQLVNGGQTVPLEPVVNASVKSKVARSPKPMPPFDPNQERVQESLDVVSTLEVHDEEDDYEEDDEPIYNPDPLANAPVYNYNQSQVLENLDNRPTLPTELQGNSQPNYVPPEVAAQQKPVVIPYNNGVSTFSMSKKMLMQDESPIGILGSSPGVPQQDLTPRPGMVIPSPTTNIPIHIHSAPPSDQFIPAVKVNMQELTKNMK